MSKYYNNKFIKCGSSYLSLISQGKYDKNLVNKYDPNYYHPYFNGNGIDIALLDNDFKFDYIEFSNTIERTAKCVANINNGQANSNINKNNCGSSSFPHGGILADTAGGLVYGVVKGANIYAVNINKIDDNKHTDLDVLVRMQYFYKKLIRDIVVANAGNSSKYLSKGSNVTLPCEIDNVICDLNNNMYTVGEISNYGPSVDVYTPVVTHVGVYFEPKNFKIIFFDGTSYSSLIVSGIIVVHISENSNIKYTPTVIRNFFKRKWDNVYHGCSIYNKSKKSDSRCGKIFDYKIGEEVVVILRSCYQRSFLNNSNCYNRRTS
ncbi:hypothetical protein BCR32DRAFT_277785 [Anaeromyces robustus]|uniref:Peptidase S8/S53 domain-containing protein n=1 Tax=Anaeromyces robustus TaxID=1754192 RepID=A0A1Y1XD80_9FUNG|nr:hypothetical protein BCR32DRAFT_277785 [Anaeromyces robustus]|eukprot:ORX83708.1 hypothetical protein BCR32DRAFT_277785 [Anaeromyces robustus]